MVQRLQPVNSLSALLEGVVDVTGARKTACDGTQLGQSVD